MAQKRHSVDQIIIKVRRADIELGNVNKFRRSAGFLRLPNKLITDSGLQLDMVKRKRKRLPNRL